MSAKRTAKPVHLIIDERLQELKDTKSGVTMASVAQQIGLQGHVMLSNMRHGRVKLPVSKARAMARALQLNEDEFIETVIREYTPDLWDALTPVLKNVAQTDAEKEVLQQMRKHNAGKRAGPVDAKSLEPFVKFIKNWTEAPEAK